MSTEFGEGVPAVDSAVTALEERKIVVTTFGLLKIVIPIVVSVVAATWVVSNAVNVNTSSLNDLHKTINTQDANVSRLQGEMKGRFDSIDLRLSQTWSVAQQEQFVKLLEAMNEGKIRVPK